MVVAAFNKLEKFAPAAAEDPRVKRLLKVIDSAHRRPDMLIQCLHTAQESFGYLPLPLIALISKELNVPPSRVYGVATFYNFFSLKPKGEHTCLVCTGTACYVKGAQKVVERVEKGFGIKAGETTPDNKLGLETARCLGACGLAPVVVLDNDIHAKADPAAVEAAIRARLGDR